MDMARSMPESRARVLWALARPRGIFWVPVLVLLGYGFAHWDRALELTAPGQMIGLYAAWLLLQAGTLWLNAALDRDQGPVLFGEPVAVFAGIEAYGYVALVASVVLATACGATAGACALICAVLAVGYSHPKLAWKGHPLGGPLVNVLGYGVLSPLAGQSIVGVPVDVRTATSTLVVAGMVLGSYFAGQAFQGDEDRARGYRTLVATHGPAVVLACARGAFAVGFGAVLLLALVGWYPRPCLLALPGAFAVDRYLAAWASRGDGGDEAAARALVLRVLAAGSLVVVGATLGYFWNEAWSLPPAGLGTVAGWPDVPPVGPG